MDKRLRWISLVLLHGIIRFHQEHQRPPIYRDAYDSDTHGGFVNEWLEAHNIPPIYGSPLRSNLSLWMAIRELRSAGLIKPSGKLTATKSGYDLYSSLGEDWSRWPHYIPVHKGRLQLSQAELPPQFE